MNDEAVYRAAPATPGLLKKTFVDFQIPQYELVTLTLDKRKKVQPSLIYSKSYIKVTKSWSVETAVVLVFVLNLNRSNC